MTSHLNNKNQNMVHSQEAVAVAKFALDDKSVLKAPTTTIPKEGNITTFYASKTKVTFTSNPHPVPDLNSAEVWSHSTTTDHMVTAKWTADQGWEAPHRKPYAAFTIMPTASCLHYATQCFEGMKCYRGYDGKLRLFRPNLNCERLVISAARVSLPAFDPVELEKMIKKLMKLEGSKWLPKSEGGRFLYLRPAMIGNGQQLGAQLPREALLFVIAVLWPDHSSQHAPGTMASSPGLKLFASKAEETRAWPGGFGYAKVGANYGTSFASHGDALARGFDQVLWLFGSDCQVTEAGASNFFVIWRNNKTGRVELVTAPLDGGIILAGVTRRSVIELAKEKLSKSWDNGSVTLEEMDVVERSFTMQEVIEARNENRLIEAFVSGTAYFITPVSHIEFRGLGIDVPMSEKSSGKYARMFKGWLKHIMYGLENHPWGVVVEED